MVVNIKRGQFLATMGYEGGRSTTAESPRGTRRIIITERGF